MDQVKEVIVINDQKLLKNIFENDVIHQGSQFVKIHRSSRRLGGENLSGQIVLDNVDVQIPMIFGIGQFGIPYINNIDVQTNPGQNNDYTHVVFNGGKYRSIHFNKFRLSSQTAKTISHRYVPELTIEINGGEFLEPIRFSNSRLSSIKINGGIFHAEVCFERGVYDHIEISGGEFKRGLYFGKILNFDVSSPRVEMPPQNIPTWTSTYNGLYKNILISGGICKEAIILANCFIGEQIQINSKELIVEISGILVRGPISILEGNCSLSGSKADKILIGGKKVGARIISELVDNHFNLIQFKGYIGKESSISFQNQNANQCKFENFINYGGIVFNNLNLNDCERKFIDCSLNTGAQALNQRDYYSAHWSANLSLNPHLRDEINNTYQVAIVQVIEPTHTFVQASIQFLDSDMGKISFFGSKIDKAKLYFRNAKLMELFLAGANLPGTENIDTFGDQTQRRLAMSQIKKIYENRGDVILAGQYQFSELEILRNQFNKNKNSANRSERISLNLNFSSNRHGHDWLRSVVWLIGLGFLLWFIICCFLFDLRFASDNLVVALNSGAYFIQFLLPIHKFNLAEEFAINIAGFNGKSPKWIIPIITMIDGIWRIISGYLVYQTIAAFRKHGRK